MTITSHPQECSIRGDSQAGRRDQKGEKECANYNPDGKRRKRNEGVVEEEKDARSIKRVEVKEGEEERKTERGSIKGERGWSLACGIRCQLGTI